MRFLPRSTIPFIALLSACGVVVPEGPLSTDASPSAAPREDARSGDARHSRDARADSVTKPLNDAWIDAGAGCAFELDGALDAVVTGGTAAAYPAGAEIPFLYYDCAGVAGGVSYTLTGQFVPNDDSAMWLYLGAVSAYSESFASANECQLSTSFSGPRDASLYDAYGIGQLATLTFTCAMSGGDAGEQVSVRGWLRTTITSRP